MAANPKLIVLSEQLRGQSFDLTDKEYMVGRSEDCAVCIPDPTVSNHHCTLIKNSEGADYAVQDEGSTNGTRVNGMKIDRHKLVNSDILQVGAIEMLYDSEEKKESGTASTQTGINLQTTAGTSTISSIPNFSPFGSNQDSGIGKSKMATLVMAAVIGVLIIAVLVVMGMLLFKLITV